MLDQLAMAEQLCRGANPRRLEQEACQPPGAAQGLSPHRCRWTPMTWASGSASQHGMSNEREQSSYL
jgi:hypothetical protein